MEQAFQDYLNEVVAHMAGMPIRRRDEMSPERHDQVRDAFEAGYAAANKAEGY